ncbi:MAG TPA: PH domain-containing protein [Anaerolineales bacterium]
METVYGIAPAGVRPFYILVPVFLLLAAVLSLLAIAGYASRHARFVVTEAGLDLRGDIYGKAVPWKAIRTSEARLVDLSQESGLRPRSRRLGTGLPGYAAGWFRLNNGERALVYLTRFNPVVYVPTTLGYSLLLSPQDPDSLLAALRRRPTQP